MPNGFCGLHALFYLTKGSNLVPSRKGPDGIARYADVDEEYEFLTPMCSGEDNDFGWVDLRSMF